MDRTPTLLFPPFLTGAVPGERVAVVARPAAAAVLPRGVEEAGKALARAPVAVAGPREVDVAVTVARAALTTDQVGVAVVVVGALVAAWT